MDWINKSYSKRGMAGKEFSSKKEAQHIGATRRVSKELDGLSASIAKKRFADMDSPSKSWHVLYFLAQENHLLKGKLVQEILAQCGFYLLDTGYFEYETKGVSSLRVLNIVKPGTFNVLPSTDFETPGLVILLTVTKGDRCFRTLLKTMASLGHTLDNAIAKAYLSEALHQPFSSSKDFEKWYFQQLKSFEDVGEDHEKI